MPHIVDRRLVLPCLFMRCCEQVRFWLGRPLIRERELTECNGILVVTTHVEIQRQQIIEARSTQ